MDPRSELPSFVLKSTEVETMGPETAVATDDVEKYLGLILDAFPQAIPNVSQLTETPSLPWVLAGEQRVINFVRTLREGYRKTKGQ